MRTLVATAFLCLLPLSAFSATLVDSYIDGANKVCEYDDGSTIHVAVTAQCPVAKY